MKTITDNELIDTSRGKKRLGALFDENAMLHANNDELVAALEDAVKRMEYVADSIPVSNRANGVSQAKHVLHMAGHLEQHAKKARAILEQVKK